MLHPHTILLGMLATLCLGTPPLGRASVALLGESYAYSSDETPSSDTKMLIYKPLKKKDITGRTRIGGFSRGSDAATPSLIALVPDHIGLTMKHDTAVCWYLERQTAYPFTLTVTDAQQVLPILEQVLPFPSRAGVHCARLQDYGVTLNEEKPYRWFVTLVVHPDHPSQDIVAGGMIELIPYNEACMLGMPCPCPSCGREAVYRYAESGLWYDAVTCLEHLIQHDGDHTLQRMQDVLLRQVGIQLPN